MSNITATPTGYPITDQDECTPEQARLEYVDGLRALAAFIEQTPGCPLPSAHLGRHFDDADEFDAGAAVLGGRMTQWPPYEHCTRRFGVIEFDIQTNGRDAQQVRQREQRIAERERELGLA